MARPRTDIRPRIVHAARKLFLADGVDGASLREVARQAKTNIGMVFYYFPQKDQLFLAVVEEIYATLLLDLERELSESSSPREKLERAFRRLGRASAEELDVIRLVVREALLSSERFEKILARVRQGHLPMILQTLAEANEAGEIDRTLPLPMLLACTMGIGVLPQLMKRAVGDEPPFSALPDADALAALSVQILFRAIGSQNTTA